MIHHCIQPTAVPKIAVDMNNARLLTPFALGVRDTVVLLDFPNVRTCAHLGGRGLQTSTNQGLLDGVAGSGVPASSAGRKLNASALVGKQVVVLESFDLANYMQTDQQCFRFMAILKFVS